MRRNTRVVYRILALVALALLAVAPVAAAAPSAQVAAVQVGLRSLGLYAGHLDGRLGPETGTAVRTFQQRHGLAVDGVPGPSTRAALERRTGRLRVAALQFRLAQRGFPPGLLDGRSGPRTEAAVRRFQRFAGLPPDGVAGPATLAALQRPPAPLRRTLRRPVDAPAHDGFGPRGGRFHAGIDYPAPGGTPVVAAAAGRVSYAAPLAGGWGNVVSVAHGGGVRTLYAHLGRIDVRVGRRVRPGERLGTVGATGHATGTHLHFEVRLRGAAIDPARAFRR